jgi:MFS family permease
MAMIGGGIIWATQVPAEGHFLANLAGPMAVAGAGTAFSFIPISVAALSGIRAHEAGLASGLLNTSQQLGGVIGIALASSVADGHTTALLHVGRALPDALAGGFARAFLVLGILALLSLPVISIWVRDNKSATSHEPIVAGDLRSALVEQG